MAVVEVINRGTAKDLRLQELLCAFLCAMGQFEVVAYHLMGSQNRVPDILSRMHISEDYVRQFQEIKQPDWHEVLVTTQDLEIHEHC